MTHISTHARQITTASAPTLRASEKRVLIQYGWTGSTSKQDDTPNVGHNGHVPKEAGVPNLASAARHEAWMPALAISHSCFGHNKAGGASTANPKENRGADCCCDVSVSIMSDSTAVCSAREIFALSAGAKPAKPGELLPTPRRWRFGVLV